MITRIIFLSFFLCACSAKFQHKLDFDPTQPLRVAILPFAFVDENGAFQKPDKSLLIDNLSLVSSKLSAQPDQYVQRLVQTKLAESGLDVIMPAIVDAQLSHRGFLDSKLEYDLPRIFKTPARTICQELLSCDAVLYGEVTRWERGYYAVQSVSTVAVNLKLVSARDGKVLFSAQAEDSDSRGITKGPTGFSNLVLEPIKGLDNEIIANLAEQIVQQMLNPLIVSRRAEFLTTPPPAIFASAHDAKLALVNRKKPLIVLAIGSPGVSASFSIGEFAQNIPMTEKDAGHYIGEYYALTSDAFSKQVVEVALTDKFGRTTTQRVGVEALSLN